jgi:predicted metal-dependent hydrolase
VIRLNWRLMQAPPALIDYVVVHELAHLRQPDHSAAFWSLVARACPDHRALRRELRGWQRRLAAL